MGCVYVFFPKKSVSWKSESLLAGCFIQNLCHILPHFLQIHLTYFWLLYNSFYIILMHRHNHLLSSSWKYLMILAQDKFFFFLSPHQIFALSAISTALPHIFNFIHLSSALHLSIRLDVHLCEDCYWHLKYYTWRSWEGSYGPTFISELCIIHSHTLWAIRRVLKLRLQLG